jgi:hypothetical protein
MEEGWERPLAVNLSREELQHLVEPAFPGATIFEAVLITTGLANTNIRFRLQGREQVYVLRLHTREPQAAASHKCFPRRSWSSSPAERTIWCLSAPTRCYHTSSAT